jgi:hypothetical protein
MKWLSAARDGRERELSKISTIERRRFVSIHEEDLALGRCATALPGKEPAAAAVPLAAPPTRFRQR